MTMIKAVDPQDWINFMADFSARNRGRRARFEIFGRHGEISEERQEGYFQKISVNEQTVTVLRTYENHAREETMTDNIANIRGISVQYDTDLSEDMLELTATNGNLTALHFESLVDGDS